MIESFESILAELDASIAEFDNATPKTGAEIRSKSTSTQPTLIDLVNAEPETIEMPPLGFSEGEVRPSNVTNFVSGQSVLDFAAPDNVTDFAGAQASGGFMGARDTFAKTNAPGMVDFAIAQDSVPAPQIADDEVIAQVRESLKKLARINTILALVAGVAILVAALAILNIL